MIYLIKVLKDIEYKINYVKIMSIKNVTIVITSFKSNVKITNCLNSINGQCNVIVVENSNDLEFKKNIEEKYSNVDCILTGQNFGYGKANNIGLKRVTSKYALILNPDTEIFNSTLENFFKVIKEVPDFAILSPYIQETRDENKKVNTPAKQVPNVKGFAMFLNLSQFAETGFFDENFFIYFEEIDLCRRLIKYNKKIYLAPLIKIFHEGGKSHDTSINRPMELSRNWHWMWSTFYYHKKYKGFFISLLIVLPKLSSSVFKFLLYSLILNKEKREIYYHRYSGLMNAILGKKSWYRPNV